MLAWALPLSALIAGNASKITADMNTSRVIDISSQQLRLNAGCAKDTDCRQAPFLFQIKQRPRRAAVD
ncbi:MAG: hypothetical protein LBP58_08965 [Azoarcus sp.]|jgi:hypothetical protein|nr:hypothetical protein [Azoarcus sp.]